MDTHELRFRQPVLELFHTQQDDDGLLSAVGVNLQVFAHALDESYIIDFYAYYPVLGLEENGVVAVDLRHYRLVMAQVVLFFYLRRRAPEIGHRERFEQIVDGVDLVAVDGIVAVGRREDNQRRHVETLDEVHAVDVGHIDVDEQRVDGLAVHNLLCFRSTLALAGKLKKFHFLYVCRQLPQGQWLIVDSQYSYHDFILLVRRPQTSAECRALQNMYLLCR